MSNKASRIRRAKRARMHIRRLGVPRLTVHRSGQHLYAQVISQDGNVLAAASTLQKELREGLDGCKNIKAATKIGQVIAERAKAAGVETVAFDRSGFRYHGRVKAMAEAAREAGLSF